MRVKATPENTHQMWEAFHTSIQLERYVLPMSKHKAHKVARRNLTWCYFKCPYCERMYKKKGA